MANAVWMYDDALPESHDIRGHVGFMPDAGVEIDLGDNVLRADPQESISGPLIDWLLREAAYLNSPEAFTEALADRMRAHGIALSRLNVMIWSLHPLNCRQELCLEKVRGRGQHLCPVLRNL